ncbi:MULTISPECIES: TauD/TfdA family dioxygenase [Streptomyces]|uniref:TauD/TfdA family dioxygenase n=1 Tax=Streptomyces cyaneofuscatus TaxID=66883 RepID=A0ABZ1F4A4_9ACTN|nr:TauD/TfdA family dioxygenase [Streptomyces cyaneofuscatus]WSB11212.1 TauD/TfdA family dioxygenase [Streptomyces cyaneofuscatus]WSD45255.1 TauD/TfdA family dioxygenase [Streptomyces cyaneofuscatus]WTA88449.1 TauD/TfdA family dioxygenase [Streptomyces cyaneofuscatus]
MSPHPAAVTYDAETTAAPSRTAELLASTAHDLVAAGATPQSFLLPGSAATVPDELREALGGVLTPLDRTSGWRRVRGLFAAFPEPGPTPAHWSAATGDRQRPWDLGVILVSSVLGRLFGWTGQQDGRLVHNIVPSRGCETVQVGASSTTPLTWHNEDAFHPRRAELLMLACVRNPDGVGTRAAGVRRAAVSEYHREQLRRPVVSILPDASYPADAQDSTSRPRMSTMWPDSDGWCLRYDPAYSRLPEADPAFHDAYGALGEALEASAAEIGMEAGDVVLIDNDVAVHGRAPFRALYDGSDRWLKRSLIRLPRRRPDRERDEDGFGQALVGPAGDRW